MPYQRLLDDLVRAVDASGALLLDAEGDRHRLIGAYKGLALATVRKTVHRHGGGDIAYLLYRYTDGVVILRPLKDGYYLVLSLPVGGRVGEALHRSGRAQESFNREL